MNAEQRQLVELAKEMNEICESHGIKFVIGFGCAIGAERNRGFLPWDDDIDLITTRAEMRKLEKVLQADMPKDRDLVTDRKYPGYHHSLVRYVNEQSTRLADFRIPDGTPPGQLLEFFIFDPIPDGKEARDEYEKWLWLYTELQASVVVVARAYSPVHAIDEELYNAYLERMKTEGRQAVLDEIEREHLTFDEKDCEYMACRWGSQLLLIRRDWWDDIEYRDFGGAKLPFFRDNIEHLQLRYGYTWNIVPPEGEEHVHEIIVNADIPYGQHIDAIRAKAEEEGMLSALEGNKQDYLSRMFGRYRLQEFAAHSERAFLRALRDTMNGNGWFNEPFDPERTALWKQRFEPFYEVLFRFFYVKWNMPPELTDSMKEKLFLTLLWSDEIDRCETFLDLYAEGWEKADHYREACALLWELQRVRYGRDMRRAEQIADSLDREFGMGAHIAVERIRMRIIAQSGSADTFEQKADVLRNLVHREDPEVQKYLGDLLLLSGEKQQAEEAYARASGSNDGMLLLELDDSLRKMEEQNE